MKIFLGTEEYKKKLNPSIVGVLNLTTITTENSFREFERELEYDEDMYRGLRMPEPHVDRNGQRVLVSREEHRQIHERERQVDRALRWEPDSVREQDRGRSFKAILDYYGFKREMMIPHAQPTIDIAIGEPMGNLVSSVSAARIEPPRTRRLRFHLDQINGRDRIAYYRLANEDRI